MARKLTNWEVKILVNGGSPEPQGVDHVILVSGDWVVIGHSQDGPGVDPLTLARLLILNRPAAEPNLHLALSPLDLKSISELEPVVGTLNLTREMK